MKYLAGKSSNYLWVELSLLLLALSIVSTSSRSLVEESSFLSLLIVAGALYLFLVALRHLGVPEKMSHSLTFIFLVLLEIYILFPETLIFGLPTPSGFTAYFQEIGNAIALLDTGGLPVTGGNELQALLSILVLISIILSDLSAFTHRKAGEALIPLLALLLVTLYIGPRNQSILSIILIGATGALFILIHRHMLFSSTSKPREKYAKSKFKDTKKILMLNGSGIAGLVIIVGALLVPTIPGVRSPALIDSLAFDIPFAGTARNKVILNPLLDISNQLLDTSNIEVFKVQGDIPRYWKIANLDTYNTTTWSISDNFDRVGAGNSNTPPDTESLRQKVEYSFSIENLGGSWLPQASFSLPNTLEFLNANIATLYNSNNESFLIEEGELTQDTSYTLTSSILNNPDYQILDSKSRQGTYPDEILYYTKLPSNIPQAIVEQAKEITATGKTDYQKALLLQDWFIANFTYSETVPSGHHQNALLNFLDVKEGFCEQFSATFAVMARALGIPSRVSVGFTTGKIDSESKNTYIVNAQNAHAWPEIYIPEIGWVDFEPTPSRGYVTERINIEDISVARVVQNPPTGGSVDSEDGTGTITSTLPDAQPPVLEPNTQQSDIIPPETLTTSPTIQNLDPIELENKNSSTDLLFLIILICVSLLFALYIFGVNYVRRNLLSHSYKKLNPQEYITLAWISLISSFTALGLTKHAYETRTDFSKRTSSTLGIPSREMNILAQSTNEVQFSSRPASATKAKQAKQSFEILNQQLRNKMSFWKKLLMWVNPKPALKLLLVQIRLKRLSSS